MNDLERPISNTQRAIDELRSLIFSGELEPDSEHLESELARRLSMSRTPVRAAALTLAGQGLLELRPRKGVRVLPLTSKDMTEIFDILMELEGFAAGRAAEIGYTDADLNPLSDAVSGMDLALADNARDRWAEADERFHCELVRLGDNRRLVGVVQIMRDQVRRARSFALRLRPFPIDTTENHRNVVNAIRNREPELARRIHRGQRERMKVALISVLEAQNLSSGV